MTKSTITREKAQWLHDACEEAAAAGIKLTMNPSELLMFTSYALAAMDSKTHDAISFDEWSRKCALQITLCYPDFREKAQYIWDSARETQHATPVVPDDVRQALCKMDDEIIAELDAEESACRAAMLQGADGKPHLTVWYGSMPETNGKTNWTAILHRKGECLSTGITVCRSEYPDRVRYEADRMRHLIGDLADEPNILAYDADAHSGYVPPAAPQSPGRDTATVPGKWIPVSERMPESNGVYFGWDGKRVLEVYCFFGGFSANQFIHGEITHWMPLPAAPQEDINALIPLASRNEQEVK